jgi:hypothetical protein
MDYDVDAVIKRAGRLLDAGDPQSLDQAEMLLDNAIEECTDALEKGKRRKKVKADGTATDTWSPAADDEDEDDVGKSLDNIEEALDDVIEKLGRGAAPRYPHGSESDLLAMHAGDVTVHPDRAHVGIVPAMQAPSRHRFDDLVDEVHARDGGSRAAAMVTARSENPTEFSSYQRWQANDAIAGNGPRRHLRSVAQARLETCTGHLPRQRR